MRCFVIALMATTVFSSTTVAQTRRVLAVRSAESLVVDGILNETIWHSAPSVSDFLERSPRHGAAPPVRTAFAIAFDDDSLYAAIWAYDDAGERATAYELRRDSEQIWEDDSITLKFDVQNDRRTTLGFSINAASAQLDYVALDSGLSQRIEYDLSWECAARVEDGLWTAELRIPFAALGLTSESAAGIGFNVTRNHHVRRATYDWALAPRGFGGVSAAHYGKLVGLSEAPSGHAVAISTYARHGFSSTGSPRLGYDTGFGADLATRLGEDLWLDLTAFTDFSGADLDDPQVAASRYPLFLPETRDFFLAGIEAFEFGANGKSQPFFSRKIGLSNDGETIPILGGAKLHGHAGRLELGILDVITDSYGPDAARNAFVLRGRYDVSGDRSDRIGWMMTSRNDLPDPSDVQGNGERSDALAVGVDVESALFDRRLRAYAFSAVSAEVNDREIGSSIGARVQYKGEYFRPTLTFLRDSDGYAPPLGYVRERGSATIAIDLLWTFEPTLFHLQTATINASGYATSTDEVSDATRIGAEIGASLEWRSGWSFDGTYGTSTEEMSEPFEIVSGVEVAAGEYANSNVNLSIESPSNHTFAVSFEFTHEEIYDGAFDGGGANLRARLGRHFQLGSGAFGGRVSLPQYEAFYLWVGSTHAAFAFSAHASLDSIVQLKNVEEHAQTGDAIVVFERFRWTYSTGSDFFAIAKINHDLNTRRTEYEVMLKLGYRIDLAL